MPEIQFEIAKSYGVISEEKSGWKKELNWVAWNGKEPKFDIRDWSPDHQKMGKGITFTKSEAEKLAQLLSAALAAE